MSERFGRYTLLKRLGAGGMGEVFLAKPVGSEGTDHFVVVKTLLPQLAEDEDLVRMFLEEAKLAAQLDHPNICRVLDLGLEDGILFMALEFIRGVDLERLQKEAAQAGVRVPVPIAMRIAIDAARGLQHAHQLTDSHGVLVGLVHRDVSPHNLLVTFDGKVKVIDFGLAKTVGRAQQSHTGSLKGKFAYMSPEMVRAERIDLRVDVFALGIILHELLTGERLFRRDNDVATLAAIAQCEVPRPGELNPSVPPELDQILLKALAKDRPRRYQSAGELADALEALLAKYGGGRQTDLAAWMRELHRERLEEEAARGLLHDAPEGRVMKMRGLASGGDVAHKVLAKAEALAQPPPAPGKLPVVITPESSNPGAPPPSPDAATDEAALDEHGLPTRRGGVRLAPRPELAAGPRLAAVARPSRIALSKLPPPVPMGDEADVDPEERTLPPGANSPFDEIRREALRLSGEERTPRPGEPPARPKPEVKTSVLARGPRLEEAGDDEFTSPTRPMPPRRRPAPVQATVPLAPAYIAPEPSGPMAVAADQKKWIGLGIGLAIAVVAIAVTIIALA